MLPVSRPETSLGYCSRGWGAAKAGTSTSVPMSVSSATALARWQRSLELLAKMPPEITANLINARLLADVAWLMQPDKDTPVELRVVVVWSAAAPEAALAGELARSSPGARLKLTVVSVRSPTPAGVVREQLAGAHAVVIVAG